MTAPDALSLAQVAAEIGRHPDTVKKNWRGWANPAHPDYCGFPQPFIGPRPGRRVNFAWRASAINAWKLARETALGAACAAAPPSNENHPGAAHHAAARSTPRLVRERAQLLQLMERA